MRNNKGFTLIEVMIVVAIVAILASIAVPSYQSHIIKSKIKEAQANLIALSLSAESAYPRTLSYPKVTLANTADIKNSDVFNTWNASSAAFNYEYTSTDGVDYTVTATGIESKVAGCTLSLDNVNTKTITSCPSFTHWVN